MLGVGWKYLFWPFWTNILYFVEQMIRPKAPSTHHKKDQLSENATLKH